MLNIIGLPGVFMVVIYAAILIVPFWKIWGRAGHSPWISLLMLIPIVNLITLYVLAFKEWPLENNKG